MTVRRRTPGPYEVGRSGGGPYLRAVDRARLWGGAFFLKYRQNIYARDY